MTEHDRHFNQVIHSYGAILNDLATVIASVEDQGLVALEAALAHLDTWNQQIIAGGNALRAAASGPSETIYAGAPRPSDEVAEIRGLITQILAQCDKLENIIRVPMRVVADELVQVNKSRLYLKSLRNACPPISPHIQSQG